MLSMIRLTTSMPTPRPAASPTVSAVEKPGRKMILMASASDSADTDSGRSKPRVTPLALILAISMPPPSSSTSITTALPRCEALI